MPHRPHSATPAPSRQHTFNPKLTRFWYAGGRLARIEDPGSELTDYSYNTEGLLAGVRDPLGADWVAQDPTNHPTADATTQIAYITVNGKPAAGSISAPVPAPGQPRPQHTYRYDPAARTTFVDVAGLSPAIGFFTRVVYDSADRLLSSTDATGRTSSQTWSVKDQQLTSTDPAGRVSTTVYDVHDRPTDQYGPAPASCFTGQLPTPACAATVPHTRTSYDQNINGLAVAWYDNRDLTGAPKVYTTGTGTVDGRLATSGHRHRPRAFRPTTSPCAPPASSPSRPPAPTPCACSPTTASESGSTTNW
jgi:YD repeat-containing protein